MKLFNYISIIIISCLFIFFTYWFFNKNNSTKADQELVVGTAGNYAPFVSINPQGEYEGFDIDVAQELARRMNKKLLIKDCGSMVPLILSLKNNSADLLIWALEINQARLKEMEMVQYQGENIKSYPLIFWQNIPENIKSISDLKNKDNAIICVEPGSTQELFLNKFKFVNKKSISNIADIIMDIKYGKSLAALVDPALIKTLTKKNPELKILDIPLDKEFMSYGNGICINKNNKKLIEQIKNIVASMKADGTIKKLEEKWQLISGDSSEF